MVTSENAVFVEKSCSVFEMSIFYILCRFNNLESCGVMMLAHEVSFESQIIWI